VSNSKIRKNELKLPAGAGGGEFAGFDALGGFQQVGHFADFTSFAFDDTASTLIRTIWLR
jgi:hypothetical protein